jgi:hypothetical protein
MYVTLLLCALPKVGMASLEGLFRAVEPHTGLRQQLINCLLNEALFHHKKGPNLHHVPLRGFFGM